MGTDGDTDAMAAAIDGLDALDQAGGQSGPRRLQSMQQMFLQRAGSSNPLLRTMTTSHGDWPAKVLAVQAPLRLLRLAVLWMPARRCHPWRIRSAKGH